MIFRMFCNIFFYILTKWQQRRALRCCFSTACVDVSMVCKMPWVDVVGRTQFQGVEFDLLDVGRGQLQRYLLKIELESLPGFHGACCGVFLTASFRPGSPSQSSSQKWG